MRSAQRPSAARIAGKARLVGSEVAEILEDHIGTP